MSIILYLAYHFTFQEFLKISTELAISTFPKPKTFLDSLFSYQPMTFKKYSLDTDIPY